MSSETRAERAGPPERGAGAATRWLGLAIALLALCLLFAFPLMRLGELAWHNDADSHIPLMPVIAAYLVWSRRARVFWSGAAGTPSPSRLEWFPGALLVTAGGVLFPLSWALPGASVAGGAPPALSLAITGFVLGVVGLFLMFWGRAAVRELVFPLGLLAFMIPLPATWVPGIEGWLARQSAAAAYVMLKAGGFPVVRHGVTLNFPGLVLKVAHECSGIRSTLVLVITGVLLAGLCLRTGWRRALLVAVVVPLGIVRNGFRVFCLAALSLRFDPSILNSPLHHQGGPIFFVLALAVLLGLLWVLAKTEGEPRNAQNP